MSAGTVAITLPGTNVVWYFWNAAPSADGDYSQVNEYMMGLANVGKVMIGAKKELNDYAVEIEWNASALTAIKDLTGIAPTWDSTHPPTTADLVKLYAAGAMATAPGAIDIGFYETPSLHAKRWISIEEIKRVPPDYPALLKPLEPGYYMRTDGTCFWYGNVAGQFEIEYGTVEINWDNAIYEAVPEGSSWEDLLPGWLDAMSAQKTKLTEMAQTQMSYLQDRTEIYDRLIALMTALIEALKKLISLFTK